MERPVVIVTMVRNKSRGDVGFAKKPERVNVAFSRTQ
ncbi:MAG: AAA domain-containing protein [Nostoc sp.]